MGMGLERKALPGCVGGVWRRARSPLGSGEQIECYSLPEVFGRVKGTLESLITSCARGSVGNRVGGICDLIGKFRHELFTVKDYSGVSQQK